MSNAVCGGNGNFFYRGYDWLLNNQQANQTVSPFVSRFGVFHVAFASAVPAKNINMPPKKKPKLLPGQTKLTFSGTFPSTDTSVGEVASNPNEEEEQVASEACASTSESTLKEPLKRHFQTTWLSLYPWLRYDSEQGKMFCDLCKRHNKLNTLGVGTDNFRTSTLTRHVDTKDHELLVSAPESAANMKKAQKTALTKREEAVVAAFKGMFWLCQENLPLAKFRSLMQLLSHLKVPFIEHLVVGENVDYTSDSSADDFLSVLSGVIDDNITEKVKQSPVITVFVDESTDIVVHHKLAINVRVVDPLTLQPKTFFLTDVRLSDGTVLTLLLQSRNGGESTELSSRMTNLY